MATSISTVPRAATRIVTLYMYNPDVGVAWVWLTELLHILQKKNHADFCHDHKVIGNLVAWSHGHRQFFLDSRRV